MDEKLIRDAMGSPVPQHYNEELGIFTVNTLDGSTVTNGDIDFSQTKLLRDKLGSVIPQVWDALNHKWVVVTTQNSGGGSGEGGPVTWNTIQGKPNEFTPSTHGHEINEINGLQDRLDEVFQQVSSGKSLLETAIVTKGGTVNKVGVVATFDELKSAISAMNTGESSENELYNFLLAISMHTDLYGSVTFDMAKEFVDKEIEFGAQYFCVITNSFQNGALYLFSTRGTYIHIDNGLVLSDGDMYSCDSSVEGNAYRPRGKRIDWSSYKPIIKYEEYRAI